MNKAIQKYKDLGIVPNAMQEAYLANVAPFSVLLAPTGTGKTFAFLVKAHSIGKFPLLLISPTRELAMQLTDNCKKVFPTEMVVNCYGGHSIEHEENQLQNSPTIVVGTPGRLLDHLARKTIDFQSFQHLIIDEYDKLLELNFKEEVQQIMQAADWSAIQLSSATSLSDSDAVYQQYSWVLVDLLNIGQPDLSFYQLPVEQDEKVEELIDLLKKHNGKRTLIFCTHREACDRLHEHLSYNGISSALYHGGLKQSERERAYIKFNRKSASVMVCTDLGARGLDLENVDWIIHYQEALNEETETHRNGRSGRNGEKGIVVYLTDVNVTNSLPLIHSLPVDEFPVEQLVTLYVDAGRKQKLRKVDFIGFLCQELNVENDAIVGVEVFDVHSYITLEKGAYKKIKDKLKALKIKKVPLRMRLCY